MASKVSPDLPQAQGLGSDPPLKPQVYGDGALDALHCVFRLLFFRSSMVNICLWAVLFMLARRMDRWWIPLLQPVIVYALDLFAIIFGWSPFAREDGARMRYEFINFLTKNIHSGGIDLGFNFYDGDYARTKEQAQLAKFEHVFTQLGLEKGMSVLDCGCGYGDWLYWLKHVKGCKVMGINMTETQAQIVRDRGIDCIHSDWQTLFRDKVAMQKLEGRYDAVTFYDTIEHYRKADETCVLRGVFGKWLNKTFGCHITLHGEHTGREYKELFAFAHTLLNPASPVAKMFSSCLHQTVGWREFSKHRSWLVFEWICMYSIYSGVYPFGEDGLEKWAPKDMPLVLKEDRTEDYRMTSILERDHFGWMKYHFSLRSLIISVGSLFLDPHMVIYHFDLFRTLLGFPNAWMWHIGGIDPKQPRYGICRLYWQAWQLTTS
eukprot:gb/GEZN01007783.1/.p1 GENE.gb/GEZN01007783.1/~~gb/GEZN01007783.1/.p1  ORF type:complete len:433 (-),score=50.52 gb/GEZN01007783.1/:156-1454(-)